MRSKGNHFPFFLLFISSHNIIKTKINYLVTTIKLLLSIRAPSRQPAIWPITDFSTSSVFILPQNLHQSIPQQVIFATRNILSQHELVHLPVKQEQEQEYSKWL